ncbi:protein kinase domain-containing protein [Anabaena azotica]|uniref:non-specific serine/threonine protein kinase n=1 Tax=Anabaena azotica FACHB-119 TaxID=947527 RepID=A0ABR8D951_9NOST|nr:YARHG domain-containing protein [Anabaena azotica]MBD2503715.1 YARHG domain-containing protein [Anabaena azotica FACHB-119]
MTIQLLNDRYQVIRTLGAGGFGETYLAEDTYMPSRRRCVVKQLRPIQNNPQIYQLVQERFQREAAILEDLGGTTDQIPGLYAYFLADGQFYLVQEWVEGDTLTAKFKQQGLLTEAAVQEILINLLPVLEYVHSQRIVHRDIKPDNIILRHRDGKPVLIDFGAVRESMGTVVNSQGDVTSSIVIGTPGYMPSEQAAGRPVYSSDLYSLGLTAIYLLTGKQPQQLEIDPQTGEMIWREYGSHISPALAIVLERAIAYHPRDRYSTARAMLDDLQALSNPIPPTQPYFTPPPVTPASPTLPVAPQATISGNNQKGIRSKLIGVGLIVASSIVQLFLVMPILFPVDENKVTEPVESKTTVTPTPVTTPPVVQIPIENIDPGSSVKSASVDVNTTDNYLWLSQRTVTDADLEGKNGYTLDIMRNTVFARHGRRFDNQDLQDYFNNQPWYNPQYSPQEFPVKLLSTLEQRNVDSIAAYQTRNNLRYFK